MNINRKLLPPMKCDGAHDRRIAGLAAKRVSPWRHGNLDTPNTRRIRAQWNQQGTRRNDIDYRFPADLAQRVQRAYEAATK